MWKWLMFKWRWWRSEERQWVKNFKRHAPEWAESQRRFLENMRNRSKV